MRFSLGFRHKAAMSRPRMLDEMLIRRYPHSRVIVDGPSTTLSVAKRSSGIRWPDAVVISMAPIVSGLLANCFRQSNHQRKPELVFEDFAQLKTPSDSTRFRTSVAETP